MLILVDPKDPNSHFGKEVTIPRIPLSSNCGLGFTLTRFQFPVKAAFAMTIHRSQGQTFDFVGLDLRVNAFTHGQLYVGCSRVRNQKSLKVFKLLKLN